MAIEKGDFEKKEDWTRGSLRDGSDKLERGDGNSLKADGGGM